MKILNLLLPTFAVAFLAFIAGSYVMFSGLPPSDFLTNAYKGGKAIIDQQTNYRHPYTSRFFMPSRTAEHGVVIHDRAAVQPGYTLYTSGHEQGAYLIDLDGNTVHEWHLPFSAIWDKTSPVKKPVPAEQIAYREVHMFPNGDLLVVYEASGDTPWGYGVARISRDSKLIWRYLGQAHHDVNVGPDGKIYLLTHEIRTKVF